MTQSVLAAIDTNWVKHNHNLDSSTAWWTIQTIHLILECIKLSQFDLLPDEQYMQIMSYRAIESVI